MFLEHAFKWGMKPADRPPEDRALFRAGSASGRHAAAIVNAIVTLAHTLDLQVVAEGVTTEERIVYLPCIGCHQAQGYHYGRPAPAESIQI